MKVKEAGSLWIGQLAYIENLQRRLGMEDSKPTSTLMESILNFNLQSVKLSLLTRPHTSQPLAVSTKPDITFAVNILARFNSNLQMDHWTSKQVLRYLKGTIIIGQTRQTNWVQRCW